MLWWLWLLLGLALLALEAVTPGGFFVFFFGCAALVVGTLAGLGLAGPIWTQWLLFSLLSVVSLLLFRGRLLAWTSARDRDEAIDRLEGETAVLLDDLAPGATGKAELRGTAWTTQNIGRSQLSKGQRCRVTRVEGLTLWVQGD
jgi:membrane protein implicated in regulation of membrane protease activity